MKLRDIEIRVVTESEIDDVYEDGNIAKGFLWGLVLLAILYFGGAVVWWIAKGALIP